MVKIDYHVAAGLHQVGLFPAAEKATGRDVVKVFGLEAAAFLAVLDAAEFLRVGFGVVRYQVLVDVFRGSIAAGPGVADGPAEETHLGTRREFRCFGLGRLFLRRFRLREEGLGLLRDVEFLGHAGNDLLDGEVFAALVVVGGSKGYGVSVQHLAIGIVIAGDVVGHLGSFDGDAVQVDFNDAAIGPDGVGAFAAVTAPDVHDVIRVLFADEVLDDVGTAQGSAEKPFLSHSAGPPG